MNRELTQRNAAALIKAAFKAKGAELSHTEALDLLAKLKGFNAWSHLKAVTAQPETPSSVVASRRNAATPVIGVTLLDGSQARWVLETNLTDRWGDLNDCELDKKPSLPQLRADASLLEALRRELTNEVSFVVRKDECFGILIEVEFESRESAEALDGARYSDVEQAQRLASYQERSVVVEALCRGMSKLQAEFPRAEFCVPPEEEVFEGRPAAWAFVPHNAMTSQELNSLSFKMLDL